MINTADNKRRLIIGIFSSIEIAANKAVELADKAYAEPVKDEVRRASNFLIESRLPAYAPKGHYYAGLAIVDSNPSQAEQEFIKALETTDRSLQDRAWLGLSAVAIYERDYSKAIEICERLKDSIDEYTYLESRRAIATAYGLSGDVEREIEILESLYPGIRRCSERLSYLKCHYANNRAVALKEAGKIDQASKWSEIACKGSHPEFEKTRNEISRELNARASKVVGIHSRKPIELQRKALEPRIQYVRRIGKYVREYPNSLGLSHIEQAVYDIGESYR